MPERWVIFVMEGDPLKLARPTYHFEYRLEDAHRLGDGSHVLYVNGRWNGQDAIGALMRDFHRTDASEMETPLLKKRVHYLKDTDEGRREMSPAFQEYYNDIRAEGAESKLLENIRSLMETLQVSASRAMDLLKVSPDDRERIAALV